MRINGEKVGIGGTIDPEAPLHILGGYDANNPKTLVLAGRESTGAVYTGVQFERSSGGTVFGMGMKATSTTDILSLGGGYGSVIVPTAIELHTKTYGSTAAGTSQRVKIDSSGNVGIGLNLSPQERLDVHGDSGQLLAAADDCSDVLFSAINLIAIFS